MWKEALNGFGGCAANSKSGNVAIGLCNRRSVPAKTVAYFLNIKALIFYEVVDWRKKGLNNK